MEPVVGVGDMLWFVTPSGRTTFRFGMLHPKLAMRQWRARVRGQRRTDRSVHYPYPLARQRPRRQGIQPDFGFRCRP